MLVALIQPSQRERKPGATTETDLEHEMDHVE
jgi:hypothetical protein